MHRMEVFPDLKFCLQISGHILSGQFHCLKITCIRCKPLWDQFNESWPALKKKKQNWLENNFLKNQSNVWWHGNSKHSSVNFFFLSYVACELGRTQTCLLLWLQSVKHVLIRAVSTSSCCFQHVFNSVFCFQFSVQYFSFLPGQV